MQCAGRALFRHQNLSMSHFMKGIVIIYAFACLLLCAGFVVHDERYPQDYFIMPVNRAIQLSGTFGELRSNHFHAGIDIKSKDGSVGEPLIAAAGGFISRIKVEASGYGNVLYIDHPNGYTTVYAHLDRFTDAVQEYVRQNQYGQRRFSVDLHPRPDQFRFAQGEVVGYLGNSGSSSGPHLHFEIRKTADQIPLNPLLFGLTVQDKEPPLLRNLRICQLDERMHQSVVKDIALSASRPGEYVLRDTIIVGAQHAGFALKAYDQAAGASNLNGIYALTLAVDDAEQFSFKLNSIPFSLTRYLNAHIDFSARKSNDGFYHRCFRLPGNALGIYTEQHDRGVITLSPHGARKVVISASDFSGNLSMLRFYIKRDTLASLPAAPVPDAIPVDHKHPVRINRQDLYVSFEGHTFYHDLDLQYTISQTRQPGCFAHTHHLRPADIPVHKYFDITILSEGLPERLKAKAFIALTDERGRIVNCGGSPQGNYITARVRTLGSFTIAIDTIAPEIIPITFRDDMRNAAKMQFRIVDNMPVEGQARGLSFEATVNGEWILMEYDAKKNMLTHHFDGRIGKGTHALRLIVRDDRGNARELNRNFTR